MAGQIEEKHTPGPWSVPHFAMPDVNCKCGYVLVDGYMGAVATVHWSDNNSCENGDNPPFDVACKNARLIAAAPDLLAAIRAIEIGLANTGSAPGQWMTRIRKPDAFRIAHEALVKAGFAS